MFMIRAIIRPEKLQDIKDMLASSNINGLSISEIMGCGSQKGWKEYVRGSEVDFNFLPKIKLEIVVQDEQTEMVIDKICSVAQTGEVGDGKIFITDVLDAVRIRTKERSNLALK